MMIHRLFSLLFFLVAAFGAAVVSAQNVETVQAEYTYYGDPSQSPAQCEAAAIEGARIKAMAKAFGTTVTQSTMSDETQDRTFFSSLSETEVRGEWLEDIGTPKITKTFDNEGNIVVTCVIKGKARALSNKAADFKALVLRNGDTERYADTRFRNGDDLRLLFQAPVDGYVAVYLTTEDRNVYTMLPYTGSADGVVKVKHGRQYVFFDEAKGDPAHGDVDAMQLVTDMPLERDRFYILFSPNPFVKANDSFAGENIPRSLSFNDFRKWLSKSRRNDPSLGVKTIDVTIAGDASDNY